MDGLDPNTAYNVQMSANTKAGASSLSKVISAPVLDADVDGLLIALIVVIVVALVMISVMGLVIIILVLQVLRMQRTMKTRNKELVELRTRNIADQSDMYKVIDKEQDTTNSRSKVEGLALSQCPAYVPVNSPSAARDEEDVKDNKNVVYETVNPT